MQATLDSRADPRTYRLLTPVVIGLLSALMGNLMVLWGDPFPGSGFTALLLTIVTPGVLVQAWLLRNAGLSRLEQITLSIGIGYTIVILATLGLQAVPGPLTSGLALIGYNAVVVTGAVLHIWPRRVTSASSGSLTTPHVLLLLLAIMLVASFLRLLNLDFSEFQGDEARAVLMAAGGLRGDDAILFSHTKGPAEILLPMSVYALYQRIDEFAARLPFAIANLIALLAVFAAVRRAFPHLSRNGRGTVGPGAALVAAALMAVDGYLVAFGRIVQYQSVVILVTSLAAWSAIVWFRAEQPPLRLAVLGALFAGVGILAHYEAVFVLPLMLWLFWVRVRRDPPDNWVRQIAVAGLVFAAVVTAFYAPFVRHPAFADTAAYITGRRIGGQLLYNNLPQFFRTATFYSSTYHLVFMILAVVALIGGRLLRSRWPRWAKVLTLGALGVGLLATLASSSGIEIFGINMTLVPYTVALAAILIAPLGDELKGFLLWFAGPFFAASFLTLKPDTHFYNMVPAWSILAGLGVSEIGTFLSRKLRNSPLLDMGERDLLRRFGVRAAALAALGIAFFALLAYYPYIVFARHTPDYRRAYPATRPAIYPVVYGDEVPHSGKFGFPHHAGWKAIGALYTMGVLDGSYAGNEAPVITSWYTRGAVPCRSEPDYYFVTNVIHDIERIPEDEVRRDYYLLGRVWTEEQPRLEIFSRQPVDTVIDYQLRDLEAAFDQATNPDVALWGLPRPAPMYRTDATLGGRVRLVGYDVGAPSVVPKSEPIAAGGTLNLVLYWLPLRPMGDSYYTFTHVESNRIWGQSDGVPACGHANTVSWQTDEIVLDGHVIGINPATPSGEYPLVVGLYDPETGERLPVAGADANEYGNAVNLGTIEVVAPTGLAHDQVAAP